MNTSYISSVLVYFLVRAITLCACLGQNLLRHKRVIIVGKAVKQHEQPCVD